MSDGHALKKTLTEFIHDVWDCGREEAVRHYLAKSYTLHHDPGDPWDGKVLDLDGYKDRLRISRAPFPDQQFAIQRLCSDGDVVTMTWLWKATHLGDLPGFDATGEIIRMSGATAYFFDPNDKLSGHWQVTDRLSVFKQLQRNKGIVG